ncbi:MAG: sensor histidine kinase, partial [Oryzihumus sp.]
MSRPTWMRPATWTLRSKLVASTVALFVTITVATGVVTVLALNGFLMGQLDSQLMAQAHRVTDGRGGGEGHPNGASPRPAPGALPPGLGGGFVHVELEGSDIGENVVVTPTQGAGELSATQLALLSRAGLSERPTTVDLGGDTGAYRLVATRSLDGRTLVTGLPVGPQRETVARLSVIIALATAFGLIAVGAAGRWLVRRNLLPLERVAAPATKVSHLP